MNDAVPVAVHGFTWTAALVGLLNILVGSVLVAFIKQRPAIKKLQNERISADDAATARLLEQQAGTIERQDTRIDQLATALDRERAARETALAHERAICEAELSVIRHRLNNVAGNFYSLIDMLEINPAATPEIVAKVKARRAEQAQTEASEKSSVIAARINATAPQQTD
jgi:xanthosine utilization system XapX-like protein